MASVTPFVQVGTYPTRNFATLGPFNMFRTTRGTRAAREDNQASDLIASCISLCRSDYIIHQIENIWGLACSL